MRARSWLGLTALIGALGAAPPAHAQLQTSGSLLVFQHFDNRAGAQSLLSVVNTSQTETVTTRWIYVSQTTCDEFDRREVLTPRDQLTVLTNFHDPQMVQGYVIVLAENALGQAIVFDDLIGSGMMIDGLDVLEHVYNPTVFEGLGDGVLTDVDGDGMPDFDGVEYAPGPDQLLFPRFLGSGPVLHSDLILIDLTGRAGHFAIVDLLIYNDNEELFSAQHGFECWTEVSLTDISGVFTNAFLQVTNHDPQEIVGAPQQESGWFELDGNQTASPQETIIDPLVLALLVERSGLTASSGRPFHFGRQEVGVQPPDCGPGAVVELWPPNHQYVDIDLALVAGVTDPANLPVTIAITAITQDEPINSHGDGNTVCDGTGIGGSVASIRAERQGGGNGRVYVIHYTATNSGGASCDGSIQVVVPHSQNGDPAVDDGQNHDSTQGC